jgi:hypothetical protein
MSKLPGTGQLPRAAEGYDPVRVEEAFAAFADRVRELEEVAGELREELRALRAERTPAVAPRQAVEDDERWPVEAGGAPSPDWVAAVPAPLVRPTRVPRLVLEGGFLLLVALFAGLADLSVPWIVLLMTTAWALVVLGEWAAAAKRSHWRLDEIAPPLGEADETTGPWDMPVVESTVVDAGPDPESRTVVTALPAQPEEADEQPEPAEPEVAAEADLAAESDGPEPAPKRRKLLRRRRVEAAAAADPWET